jgi:hypothetical protein
MGTLAEPKRQARRKGLIALAGWTGTGILLATGAGWILPVVGLAASGWLTVDWLKFRGRWGLRF